jgi:hypothetical protein
MNAVASGVPSITVESSAPPTMEIGLKLAFHTAFCQRALTTSSVSLQPMPPALNSAANRSAAAEGPLG